VGPNQTAQSEEANGYAHGDEEEGGYYEDGAFVAAPEPTSNLSTSTNYPPDAQEAYYISLASRFRDLRTLLHKAPPLPAIEALKHHHPISLPPACAKAKQQWRFLLQSQEPQMAQLGCMDMETVLEVVKLLKSQLAGTVRGRSQEKIEGLGAWIWGVLGRCNEAGQLGSEEISELRELGKRAVGLLVGIRDRSGNAYGHEEEEEGGEEQDDGVIDNGQETNGVGSVLSQVEPVTSNEATNSIIAETGPPLDTVSKVLELEQAKAILRERLSTDNRPQSNGMQAEEGEVEEESMDEAAEMPVNKQIRITLDMIITVVGEFYGQRDLLEFRDMWNGELSGSHPEDEVSSGWDLDHHPRT